MLKHIFCKYTVKMHNLQQFEHVTKMIMRWGKKMHVCPD